MYNYNETEQRVADELIKLGFHISNKGFNCIVLSTIEVYNDDNGRGICNIYQHVADRLGTTRSRVERCIRHEITDYYNSTSDIPRLLTPDVYTGSLTNSEFLCRLAYIFKDILANNTDKS